MRRDTSPITEAIFQRAADVLKLPSTPLGDTANAELLQLAHYRPEQQADRHDWGVERGDASRHLTLLIYLNDPIAGGQSAFPKAIDEKTGKPIVLHPGRGSAICGARPRTGGAAHVLAPVGATGGKYPINFH